MAMQFWQAKRKRQARTTFFLIVFFLLAALVSLLFEVSSRGLAVRGYLPPIPYAGIYMFLFIVIVAAVYYLCFMARGGSMVAESMGGWRVYPHEGVTHLEKQLYNIVEELSIASRQPMPAVYVIKANEINAFAAGTKGENAAIAVTTGALEQLNRDELEGVIAHEFGHIANQDMKIGMRLAALLMGFFLLFYIGLRLLEGSMFSRGDNDRRGGGVAMLALMILVAGCVLWFAGAILRACVSREREYLADASSVEYTRNPNGIISALKKIDKVNEEIKDMPKSGLGYAHLYFDNRSFWFRLFATHPPLKKRIAILQGKDDTTRY